MIEILKRMLRSPQGALGLVIVALILFVVIVFGGLGSLPGAFIASLIIGLVQTFAVALNGSLASLFGPLDPSYGASVLTDIWNVTIAQIAPILPYLLLVLVLIVRPLGLMGTRET